MAVTGSEVNRELLASRSVVVPRVAISTEGDEIPEIVSITVCRFRVLVVDVEDSCPTCPGGCCRASLTLEPIDLPPQLTLRRWNLVSTGVRVTHLDTPPDLPRSSTMSGLDTQLLTFVHLPAVSAQVRYAELVYSVLEQSFVSLRWRVAVRGDLSNQPSQRASCLRG